MKRIASLVLALTVAASAPGCASLSQLPRPMGGIRLYLWAFGVSNDSPGGGHPGCGTSQALGALVMAPFDLLPSLALDVALLPGAILATLIVGDDPWGNRPGPAPLDPPAPLDSPAEGPR